MDKKPYIKYKNVYVIPTFHSRIDFARLVRKAFFEIYPDLIAVELPNNIRDEVVEGIQRLPYLSLIAYADTLTPNRLNFIPIDPGDSIIEAVRIGLEYKIPTEFLDISVKDYVPPRLKLPDDYALNKIGLPAFYEKISAHFAQKNNTFKKDLRKEMNIEEYLLTLEQEAEKEAEQEPEFHEKQDIEEDIGDLTAKDVLREKYMASNLLKMMPLYNRILFIVGMAHWEDIKYFLEHPDLIQDVKIDLVPFKYTKVYNIKSSDARFLLKELPYHTYKWLKFREHYSKEALEKIETPEELYSILNSYSKLDHIRSIFLKSKDTYEEEFKEFVGLHKLKSLFQYSRNLALTEKRLLPNLFHLLISAKNIVDDDYAWKVMDKATQYPFDDESEQYDTMKLSYEGGYDPNGRYIRLRRHHPYPYDKNKKVPLKGRPEEQYPGEWRDQWEDGKWDTVSYPPEDIIEEDYFAFIRNKAIKNLKTQRVKIEEFKASLMDGIAIKETIRNWAFKQKIYVRNEQQLQGKIDTIVVIFDEDEGEPEKYPYRLDWWAEHDKESDLSLYATSPGDYLIGPGISHVEIGGLVSFFPAPRIPGIWRYYYDYVFRDTKNKAERLLKAGILYSREKYIAYVAAKPPRKYFYSLAGIKHREIVFIPLDRFNKESLKTIKHVHILAGRDKRKIAHNYIFLD